MIKRGRWVNFTIIGSLLISCSYVQTRADEVFRTIFYSYPQSRQWCCWPQNTNLCWQQNVTSNLSLKDVYWNKHQVKIGLPDHAPAPPSRWLTLRPLYHKWGSDEDSIEVLALRFKGSEMDERLICMLFTVENCGAKRYFYITNSFSRKHYLFSMTIVTAYCSLTPTLKCTTTTKHIW